MCSNNILRFFFPFEVGIREDTEINGKVETKCDKKLPSQNLPFTVNNRNTRARCEICSNLAIKAPKRRNWRGSGDFIFNFDHISHLVLVFVFLPLNM